MIVPVQSKMARGALAWSLRDLAREAGVTVSTVARFEAGRARPHPATTGAIQRALERAGIIFLAGEPPGIRCRAVLSGESDEQQQQ